MGFPFHGAIHLFLLGVTGKDEEWWYKWGLNFSVDKSKTMFYRKKSWRGSEASVIESGVRGSKFKFLGLWLGENVTWAVQGALDGLWLREHRVRVTAIPPRILPPQKVSHYRDRAFTLNSHTVQAYISIISILYTDASENRASQSGGKGHGWTEYTVMLPVLSAVQWTQDTRPLHQSSVQTQARRWPVYSDDRLAGGFVWSQSQ